MSVPGLKRDEGQDSQLIDIIQTLQGFASTNNTLHITHLLGPQYILASLLLLTFLSAFLLIQLNSMQALPTMVNDAFERSSARVTVSGLFCSSLVGRDRRTFAVTPAKSSPSSRWDFSIFHAEGFSYQQETESARCHLISRWTIHFTCQIPWEFHMMELSCGRAFLRQLFKWNVQKPKGISFSATAM